MTSQKFAVTGSNPNLLPCSFVPADVCKNCDHVIARHEYTFSVVDEYQVRNSCIGP